MAFGGGRIVASETSSGTTYTPHYYLTDHLGSTRVVVDGSNGEVLERNDYYAFGERWNVSGGEISDNRYRYNGKELQTTGDLPYTDYGARMYSGRLGRWFGVDPLAEKYYSHSPYAFCGNNPIKFVDKKGENPVVAIGGVVLTIADVVLISTGIVTTGVILTATKDGGFTLNEDVKSLISSFSKEMDSILPEGWSTTSPGSESVYDAITEQPDKGKEMQQANNDGGEQPKGGPNSKLGKGILYVVGAVTVTIDIVNNSKIDSNDNKKGDDQTKTKSAKKENSDHKKKTFYEEYRKQN